MFTRYDEKVKEEMAFGKKRVNKDEVEEGYVYIVLDGEFSAFQKFVLKNKGKDQSEVD